MASMEPLLPTHQLPRGADGRLFDCPAGGAVAPELPTVVDGAHPLCRLIALDIAAASLKPLLRVTTSSFNAGLPSKESPSSHCIADSRRDVA